MQILDRTSRHIVVELSTREAADLGGVLYTYYGTSTLNNQSIPVWLVDFAKTLLEYRTYAPVLYRYKPTRWQRVKRWLRLRLTAWWRDDEVFDPEKREKGSTPPPTSTDPLPETPPTDNTPPTQE